MALFAPMLTGSARAAVEDTPSTINLMGRGIVQAQEATGPHQSCQAHFDKTFNNAAYQKSEIFKDDKTFNDVASATSPDDLKSKGYDSFVPTKIGNISNTDIWKMVHTNIGAAINVIRFTVSNNATTPVNGSVSSANPDFCTRMFMVQISATEFRGYVGELPDDNQNNSFVWNTYTFQEDGLNSIGNFHYFDPFAPTNPCAGGQIFGNTECDAPGFVVGGHPAAQTGTTGGVNIGAVTGTWQDAAHLKLTSPGFADEIYEKKSWYADTVNGEENWSLYFLKSATGARSALISSAGKASCANPIANGEAQPTACNNCIPFVAIHQGINLGTNNNAFNVSDFDSRLHNLGGAAATFYDYNTDCSYRGKGAASLIQPHQESLIWFYLSTAQSQVATVFSTGAGNEARFTGTYSKFGPNSYQGGQSGCSGRAFLGTGSTTISTNWDMGQGNCASGAAADGTAHVLSLGGTAGEAGFTAVAAAAADTSNPDTVHDDQQTPRCETVSTDPLAWILCAISNGLASFSDFLLNTFVVQWMEPSPVGLDASDPVTGSVYQIWSAFRVYGDIVLVIALIIAVFSQAFGGGVAEALTARKTLPRLLFAAVLVNSSIYIVAFSVDISRIVGNGIRDLINAPLHISGNFSITLSVKNELLLTGMIAIIVAGIVKLTTASRSVAGAGGFGAAILPWVLVFVILPAGLIIGGVFVTLLLLQSLIMALIISSPVAAALYTLPATEKYAKMWWDWLYRALLVFPIFMTILGIANLMSALVSKANPGFLGLLIAFFLQFAPLAGVPFSFKLAGGFIGKINQLLGGYGAKLTEAVKGNPNDQRSLRNRVKYRAGSAINQARADLYARARDNSKTDAKTKGGRPRSRARRAFSGFAAKSYNYFGDLEGRAAEDIAEQEKFIAAQYSTGPDNSIRAFWAQETVDPTTGEKKWLSPYKTYDATTGTYKQKEWAASDVAKARQRARQDPAIIQAMGKYEFQKAADDGQIDAFKTRFADMANRLGWSDETAGGAWTGIVFSHQGSRKEQKFTSIKRNNDTGKLEFTDKRPSAITGEQLQYGDVRHSDFSKEMADAVRKYDYAGFRPSTAKASLEGYKENRALLEQLARSGDTSSDKYRGTKAIVDNYEAIADNLSPMFAGGGSLPPGADDDGGGRIPGQPSYGIGGSAQADAAWKEFVRYVRPGPSAPPPSRGPSPGGPAVSGPGGSGSFTPSGPGGLFVPRR